MYRLIDKHRGNFGGCISEIHIDNTTFHGPDVIRGCRGEHFRNLTCPAVHQSFNESYAERRLAYRQLKTKHLKSKSWFLEVRTTARVYGLPDPLCLRMRDTPISVLKWKQQIGDKISAHWKERINLQAGCNGSLDNFGCSAFQPGSMHPLLHAAPGNPRAVSRLQSKLKLATGTYTLQTNRKAFNQNTVEATCMLCKEGGDTKSTSCYNVRT